MNICVILTLSLLIAGPAQVAGETRPDEVIAVLNGRPIYRSKIEKTVSFKLYRMRADSFDFEQQARQPVEHSAFYVTVFMGHNDVCQDDFADIPTDAAFEANMRAGLDILRYGLPNRATVYVVGLVDIYELYQTAQEKEALGIVDCEFLWAFTLFELFPCATMLSPFNTEADRLATRERNIDFNDILNALVDEYNAADSHHYYFYTDDVFEFGVPAEFYVSNIDCFHPSADGQTELSTITWDAGPFSP